LVEAPYKAKMFCSIYCSNIGSVISALLLKVLWRPYGCGALSGGPLETAAFMIFLYAACSAAPPRSTTT
jgi:hypothetical protein